MAGVKDYTKAKQKIEECQNILARAETLDSQSKDNSVHNLLSSALDIMMRVIDAQSSTLNVLAGVKGNRNPGPDEAEAGLTAAVTTEIDALNTVKVRATSKRHWTFSIRC